MRENVSVRKYIKEPSWIFKISLRSTFTKSIKAIFSVNSFHFFSTFSKLHFIPFSWKHEFSECFFVPFSEHYMNKINIQIKCGFENIKKKWSKTCFPFSLTTHFSIMQINEKSFWIILTLKKLEIIRKAFLRWFSKRMFSHQKKSFTHSVFWGKNVH